MAAEPAGFGRLGVAARAFGMLCALEGLSQRGLCHLTGNLSAVSSIVRGHGGAISF